MPSKHQPFSFRLNPNLPHEAKAREILEDLMDKGYKLRAIVCDAILRADGITPEMFDVQDDSQIADYISSINKNIESMRIQQEQSMRELLVAIRESDPEAFRSFAEGNNDDESSNRLTSAFISNMNNEKKPVFRVSN